jgi:hypothetical protein
MGGQRVIFSRMHRGEVLEEQFSESLESLYTFSLESAGGTCDGEEQESIDHSS